MRPSSQPDSERIHAHLNAHRTRDVNRAVHLCFPGTLPTVHLPFKGASPPSATMSQWEDWDGQGQ